VKQHDAEALDCIQTNVLRWVCPRFAARLFAAYKAALVAPLGEVRQPCPASPARSDSSDNSHISATPEKQPRHGAPRAAPAVTCEPPRRLPYVCGLRWAVWLRCTVLFGWDAHAPSVAPLSPPHTRSS